MSVSVGSVRASAAATASDSQTFDGKPGEFRQRRLAGAVFAAIGFELHVRGLKEAHDLA